MSESTRPKKKRWLRWLVALLILFVVVGLSAWFYAKNIVAARIESQLAELGLGTPNIGNVSIGANGVEAQGIVFFESPGDEEPAVTLERLTIRHPISGLAAGDEVFDELELRGLLAVVDLEDFKADSTGGAGLDLSTLKLPARKFQLTDSTVVLKQRNRDDFTIEKIDAEIKPTENGFAIDGQIGQMLGGQWQVNGDVSTQNNEWTVNVATDRLAIKDNQWQRWPMVTDSMEEYLKADVEAQGSFKLQSDSEGRLSYLAEFELEKASLVIPAFDLPIDIAGARLTASDGRIDLKELNASTDGEDSISGFGTTTIAGFPVATMFNLNFSKMDVATIRKFAPAVPVAVAGRASGNAVGSVSVEQSLRTTLSLLGTGRSSGLSYGTINASSSTTQVKIEPLVLTSDLQLETLAGSVVVTARAEDLPADNIFESLDLADLASQLEINAKGTGDFRLEIPLASAEKIESWQMQIDATSPSGTFSGQPMRDIVISANMVDGNLRFGKIEAASGDEANSKIFATIDWPIATNAKHPDVGRMDVRGQQVSPSWISRFIARQIENASLSEAERKGRDSSTAVVETAGDQFSGELNFASKFELPTADPSDTEQWQVDGTVMGSSIVAKGQTLNDLSLRLDLREGVLSFADTTGKFADGGSLSADGKFDLSEVSLKAGKVRATAVPLNWLVKVGSEFSSDLKSSLEDIGLASTESSNLGGKVSIEFDLKDSFQITENDWAVSARVASDSLVINGEQLTQVVVDGELDARTIKINDARARLGGGGSLNLEGNWAIDEQGGDVSIKWEQIPIRWLAKFSGADGLLDDGFTGGEVRLSKIDKPATDGSLPISMAGTVTANKVAIGGFRSRELSIDLRTVDGVLVTEKMRLGNSLRGIDLSGRVQLKTPFKFVAEGKIAALPLTQVFAYSSVTEKIGETKNVTGVASGDFKFAGQFAEFDWQTSGGIQIGNPQIDDTALSRISANWSHVGNDWKQSKCVVEAFGGTIEMTELASKPSRLKVELSDLNAKEISSFAKIPFEIAGSLSGDASLNDWDLAEARWADLNLKGASVIAGPSKFSNFSVTAELRKNRLVYSLDGRLLQGKFSSSGETELSGGAEGAIEFPVKIQLTNGKLSALYKKSDLFVSLRPLAGSIVANADVVLYLDRFPTGGGTIKVNNLTWQNERLTREVSTTAKLGNGLLQLNNLRADLKRGEVSGRAMIPLATNGPGTYQLDVRQFDLQRFLEIVMSTPVKGAGLLDARISGQLGRKIDGRGTLAINRAKLLGLAGRTFRLPIQFQFEPLKQSGRVEFRQSRFQVFDGNVSGSATIDIGRSINLSTDLRVSNLDTEKMVAALANVSQSGQGDLSGHLVVKGNSIRSLKDLKGSFTGELDRADAFKFPILDTVSRFLGGSQFQNSDFESDDINLKLSGGRVEIRSFNLTNSLARVAVSGSAFVDGRLDLDVAARVERLNQPTLVEQLLGSPLSQFRGSPVALFAQAANFLSERLVFVKIGGTIQRPQVRPEAGKQLQEEAIRYFLRGSQILPNAERLAN
ncbi:MAG: AsmA-like C-terminal region-containing protein [Mariniblastus sp.]